mmetsp:Transcript_96737/g.273290  ORF Transcript_96737/g.273290 Transcript_96737/m.273290 type:complete len:453 (+) Transcript_96737:601-1959(+)
MAAAAPEGRLPPAAHPEASAEDDAPLPTSPSGASGGTGAEDPAPPPVGAPATRTVGTAVGAAAAAAADALLVEAAALAPTLPPPPVPASASDSGGNSSRWPSALYMISLAQLRFKSTAMFCSTNSATASFGGGVPCAERSEEMPFFLQNSCQLLAHSTSPFASPLRTTRRKNVAFAQSILRRTSFGPFAAFGTALLDVRDVDTGAGARLAFGVGMVFAVVVVRLPETACRAASNRSAAMTLEDAACEVAPPASVVWGRTRPAPCFPAAPTLPTPAATGAGAGLRSRSPPLAGGAGVPAGAFGTGTGLKATAFGFVPTALQEGAAKLSKRSRTKTGLAFPPPSPSMTSKASSCPNNLRNVSGCKQCGGHSLSDGCPTSPSSAPRCVTKSRNARAIGQPTIGHLRSSSSNLGLGFPPTVAAGATADRSACARRTCRSLFSLWAARLPARQSVAL